MAQQHATILEIAWGLPLMTNTTTHVVFCTWTYEEIGIGQREVEAQRCYILVALDTRHGHVCLTPEQQAAGGVPANVQRAVMEYIETVPVPTLEKTESYE